MKQGTYLEVHLGELRVDLVRGEGKHGDEEEEQKLKRGSNTICDEGLDALEDLARNDDGLHNHRQALMGQHLLLSCLGIRRDKMRIVSSMGTEVLQRQGDHNEKVYRI